MQNADPFIDSTVFGTIIDSKLIQYENVLTSMFAREDSFENIIDFNLKQL